MTGVANSLQRYPVGVPASADCDTVLDWMETQNPHLPNAALTTARFRWTGGFKVTGAAPDFTVTLKRPGVTLRKSVDMPVWRPTSRSMRAAWGSMISQLRAHEARHEAIATRWRATLLERLAALSLSVTADSEAAARTEANRLVNEQWEGWLAEHQAEQDSIDPYAAPLNCPGPTEGSISRSVFPASRSLEQEPGQGDPRSSRTRSDIADTDRALIARTPEDDLARQAAVLQLPEQQFIAGLLAGAGSLTPDEQAALKRKLAAAMPHLQFYAALGTFEGIVEQLQGMVTLTARVLATLWWATSPENIPQALRAVRHAGEAFVGWLRDPLGSYKLGEAIGLSVAAHLRRWLSMDETEVATDIWRVIGPIVVDGLLLAVGVGEVAAVEEAADVGAGARLLVRAAPEIRNIEEVAQARRLITGGEEAEEAAAATARGSAAETTPSAGRPIGVSGGAGEGPGFTAETESAPGPIDEPPSPQPSGARAQGPRTRARGPRNRRASVEQRARLAEGGERGPSPRTPPTRRQVGIMDQLRREGHLHVDNETLAEAVRGARTATLREGGGADIRLLNGQLREVYGAHGRLRNLIGHIADKARQTTIGRVDEIFVQVSDVEGASPAVIQRYMETFRHAQEGLDGQFVRVFGRGGDVWWSGTCRFRPH
jgi:hypothetical protein